MNDHYLVISALGPNHLDIFKVLTRLCTSTGCNIIDAQMASVGQSSSTMLYAAGNWSAIAKLEASLPPIASKHDLHVQSRRTDTLDHSAPTLPYQVQIICLDRPGILGDVTHFFAQEGITLQSLQIEYPSPASHRTSILTVNLIIQLPGNTHLASLRERFLEYCENQNLDATLEPLRW